MNWGSVRLRTIRRLSSPGIIMAIILAMMVFLSGIFCAETAVAAPAGESSLINQPAAVPACGPAITLVKTAQFTTGNGSHLNDVLTYYYQITNTGNVTLSGVTLVDGVNIPLTKTTLLPGQSCTASPANYLTLTVTQDLLDSGSVTNVATATGTAPGGSSVSSTSSQTTFFPQCPSIDIVKTFAFTQGNGSHIGDEVTYTYTVRNTGNVTLNSVTAIDNPLGPVTLSASTLAPNAVATGTKKLIVTQAMLNTGLQTNTVTATGITHCGTTVCDTDCQTVYFCVCPSINLVKSFAFTAGNGSQVNDEITYTYTVTNTGSQTLTGIALVDDVLGAIEIPENNQTLGSGESFTVNAVMAVTQQMLDNCSLTNTATVSGHPPAGAAVSAAASQTVYFKICPGIDIIKSVVPPSGCLQAGGQITYVYQVQNTGNVTLTEIAVNDDVLGSVVLSKTTLAPGETASGVKSLTVSQAVLDACYLTNNATVTAVAPCGMESVCDTASQTIYLQCPQIDLKITAALEPGDTGCPEDTVLVNYLITNTGNVTLNNVTLNGGAIPLTKTTLAPGESCTEAPPGSQNITVTQDMTDAGQVAISATAAGIASCSQVPVTDSDAVVVELYCPQTTVGAEVSPENRLLAAAPWFMVLALILSGGFLITRRLRY